MLRSLLWVVGSAFLFIHCDGSGPAEGDNDAADAGGAGGTTATGGANGSVEECEQAGPLDCIRLGCDAIEAIAVEPGETLGCALPPTEVVGCVARSVACKVKLSRYRDPDAQEWVLMRDCIPEDWTPVAPPLARPCAPQGGAGGEGGGGGAP